MHKHSNIVHYSLFLLFSALAVMGCTESFEDRCRREAREFTERQCPRLVDKYIIIDSMTYVAEPAGFTYHYRVQGELDNPEILTEEALNVFTSSLLDQVRKDISLKPYKERGFHFTYRYISSATGKLFTEAEFGPEDY